jgi:hypothetical protein
MTDKTFTMTMAQMKAMFDAGARCGEESTSTPYADFVEAVYEFVNEGIKWDEEGHTDWGVVEAMVKKG